MYNIYNKNKNKTKQKRTNAKQGELAVRCTAHAVRIFPKVQS